MKVLSHPGRGKSRCSWTCFSLLMTSQLSSTLLTDTSSSFAWFHLKSNNHIYLLLAGVSYKRWRQCIQGDQTDEIFSSKKQSTNVSPPPVNPMREIKSTLASFSSWCRRPRRKKKGLRNRWWCSRTVFVPSNSRKTQVLWKEKCQKTRAPGAHACKKLDNDWRSLSVCWFRIKMTSIIIIIISFVSSLCIE